MNYTPHMMLSDILNKRMNRSLYLSSLSLLLCKMDLIFPALSSSHIRVQ